MFDLADHSVGGCRIAFPQPARIDRRLASAGGEKRTSATLPEEPPYLVGIGRLERLRVDLAQQQ